MHIYDKSNIYKKAASILLKRVFLFKVINKKSYICMFAWIHVDSLFLRNRSGVFFLDNNAHNWTFGLALA